MVRRQEKGGQKLQKGLPNATKIKENQRKKGLEDKSIERFEANDKGVKKEMWATNLTTHPFRHL